MPKKMDKCVMADWRYLPLLNFTSDKKNHLPPEVSAVLIINSFKQPAGRFYCYLPFTSECSAWNIYHLNLTRLKSLNSIRTARGIISLSVIFIAENVFHCT